MDPKDKKPPKEQDPVQQLRDRLAALVSEQEQILNSATAAKRDLTDDENAKLEKIEADQKKLENDVARRIAAAEAQERLDRQLPSLISGDVAHEKADARAAGRNPDRRPPITGRDIEATSRTHGFASAQDWFKAIRVAAVNPSLIDRRLNAAQAAATTFANEAAGPEGGWAQPPEYSKEIVEAVMGQATLLGRMRPLQSTSNIYQIPVDETTQWGTAGVQAAKTAEGAAGTVSNLALQGRVVTLYKAVALTNVSEELATDNPATVQHITRVMSRQLLGVVERWLLRGSGMGEPVGILNAPALVSVAAEASGNGAGTLVRKNLSKCSGRLIPGYDNEAFWALSRLAGTPAGRFRPDSGRRCSASRS
jgi:HK97 family phage major capsid protein